MLWRTHRQLDAHASLGAQAHAFVDVNEAVVAACHCGAAESGRVGCRHNFPATSRGLEHKRPSARVGTQVLVQ